MAERSDVSVGDALLFAQAQRIRDLEARLSSAEEVIRPMAKAAAELRDDVPDEEGCMWDGIVALLRAGDLRRAASWSKREDLGKET